MKALNATRLTMCWLTMCVFSLPGTAQAGDRPLEAIVVGHHGVLAGDQVEWSTHLKLRERGPGTVQLLLPLSAETRLTDASDPGVELVRDAQDQVVGLRLPAGALSTRLTLRNPASPDRIDPPLILTDALQRVDVAGGTFTPHASVGLEKHVGHHAQPDITRGQRRALDHQLSGRRARLDEQPMYLVAGPRLVRAGGMIGNVREVGDRSTTVTLATAALFALLVGGLALGFRLLNRTARSEQVDSYIRSNFRASGAPGEGL